ncbi:aspartyl-phosphate phosphatase Spo0E family protein [Bacillus sp. FJAT-29790]|nr:aspartyl-phosphate phosphatase Spo0E family protein [Bacillus sp. FJAT-29790]MBU8877597.1 aspartyl-phosphate phosphatase Spo0E family protein [Bacillus sp. FJAT-29790]
MLTQIQEMREKMIDSAEKNGFTSEDTIRCSQELDQLIFEYQCILRQDQERKEEVKFSFKQMIMGWPKQVIEA